MDFVSSPSWLICVDVAEISPRRNQSKIPSLVHSPRQRAQIVLVPRLAKKSATSSGDIADGWQGSEKLCDATHRYGIGPGDGSG
jgi:hypothetical protein